MLQFSHSIILSLRPVSLSISFCYRRLKITMLSEAMSRDVETKRRVRCSDGRERLRNTDRPSTITVETVCLYRQRINISLGIAQADTLTQVENGWIRVPSPTICSTRVLRYHACNVRPIVPSRIRYTHPRRTRYPTSIEPL